MRSQLIYVPLLDEGVDVWRPALAEALADGSFRLIGPVPEGEVWQFQPGDVVAGQEHVFSDGTEGLVATKPGTV
jgi:hypothetical protein